MDRWLISLSNLLPKRHLLGHISNRMSSNSSQYMQFEMSESKSAFRVLVPGWSLDDINIVAKDLGQPHYLRTFKVLTKWEHLREIAKSQGFLDICKLEKACGTYMKCVDLDRTVVSKDLLNLGRSSYSYDLRFESRIGKIGKSSFQIDNKVSDAVSGLELFRGSLVYVTVDYKSLRPQAIPSWWSEKYVGESKPNDISALKVRIRHPEGDEIILHRCCFKVRPGEMDRFGHTNNTALYLMCSDALLNTHSEKKLSVEPPVEHFESRIKRMEIDFVGGSGSGDLLTAVVSLDTAKPKKIFCKLYKEEALICAMSQQYETDVLPQTAARI